MESEFSTKDIVSLEDIKKLNTKQLLGLFPNVLELEEQNCDFLLFFTGLTLAIEKHLTFILTTAIEMGMAKKTRDPQIINFIINELTLNSKTKVSKK